MVNRAGQTNDGTYNQAFLLTILKTPLTNSFLGVNGKLIYTEQGQMTLCVRKLVDQ